MKATEIILVDTAYWIAWLDARDQHHKDAIAKEDWLADSQLMVPWPIVYETVRTRLVRRPDRLLQFDRVLKRPQMRLVDDSDFRADAYDLAVEYAIHRRRSISMVDMLCRLLIEDVNASVDALLTTNPDDFRDICERNGVVIL